LVRDRISFSTSLLLLLNVAIWVYSSLLVSLMHTTLRILISSINIDLTGNHSVRHFMKQMTPKLRHTQHTLLLMQTVYKYVILDSIHYRQIE